jgi:hypothetical protein
LLKVLVFQRVRGVVVPKVATASAADGALSNNSDSQAMVSSMVLPYARTVSSRPALTLAMIENP